MSAFYPIRSGRKLCPISPGPAEPLSASLVRAQKGFVLINHDGSNPNGSTGLAFYGSQTDVDAGRGVPLPVGSSVSVPTDDSDQIYVMADDATTTISWSAI